MKCFIDIAAYGSFFYEIIKSYEHQHITQMTPDTVYLQKIKLPIARARKNEVSEQIRKYVRLR
ncbi:lytTr DNA-binding domain protein [Amedibacillus dolichus CAG:375]|uniref:LytTr DNA-binding domain protein n=1 Tax=Amedibacillus dolichus CAG:375 TaxID=1263076 RepID=R7G8F0_9FIRM|nr:hypothetical protein [Amedibacillus dolichus]CDE23425.1 lytTr DNA-binding domain protein [Amedibacillus dolichus CAG:375]